MRTPRVSSVLAFALYLFILLPTVVIIATSFTTTNAVSFPPVGFSFRWYPRMLADQEMIRGLKLSLGVGLTSALMGSIIGTSAALYLSRGGRGTNLLTAFLLTPLSVPTVMTGFALLLAFTRYDLLDPLGLAVAHTVLISPYIIRTVVASLAASDPALPRAAAVLGANAPRVFLHVTLPLARPGVVAGAVFAFLVSFNHVTVSAFLASPGSSTLPVVIFYRIEQLIDPSLTAAATLMIVLTLSATLMLNWRYGLFRSLFR